MTNVCLLTATQDMANSSLEFLKAVQELKKSQEKRGFFF
jgi:hypothetical protein